MICLSCVIVIYCLFGHIGQISGCPTNCVRCYDNSNDCRECVQGFYRNNYQCSQCYSTCSECHSLRQCTKCKPNNWNVNNYCYSRCDHYCDENGCEDTYGYCYNCPSGLYGTKCNQNCSLCKNQLCDLRECREGCIDGYYEKTIDNFLYCQKCRTNCSICKSSNFCLECKKGFYMWTYNLKSYCYACPSNCAECADNSKCTVCKPGQYDNNCDKKCPGDCSTCDQTNGICDLCPRDRYGDYCKLPCSEQCKDNGSIRTICDKNFGKCELGCKDGYSGDRCELVLSTSTTASTSHVEHDDRTETVTEASKQTVVIIGAGAGGGVLFIGVVIVVIVYVIRKRKQKKDDVSPLHINTEPENTTEMHGISEGRYAEPNNQSTTDGQDYIYAQPNKPKKNTHHHKEKISGQQKTYNNVAIDLKTGDDKNIVVGEADVDIVMLENIDDEPKTEIVIESRYSQPNEQSTTDGQDYIYAQPNKPKKNAHHHKEEISGPQKTYDNVAIDIDTGDDTKTTGDVAEVDVVMLENIDDEPKSVMVTEVNIPESDTYYNMAGLKRSRVQVSMLFEYIKNKTDFEDEFKKLPNGLTRTCNEALKPHNRAKNRYNGIYAYDATRVVLKDGSFINANYVEGHGQTEISYIASLGPTKSTMNNFETFWEMVWQENTNIIVMLTNLKEAKKMKCEQYWPNQGGNSIYGHFTVTCVDEKKFSDFVVRDLKVEKNSEKRTVTQYHYTAWPDKTVPLTVASLIEFRDKVEQDQIPIRGPMIVHCSAGIGRTGTYIALDKLVREGKEENTVDIFGCVIGLRGQRVNLVQNVEQYVFLHHCVLYSLTCEPTSLPVTTIPQFFTEKDIAAQFQSIQDMRLLTNKDRRQTIQAKHRKEIRERADIPDDQHRVVLTISKHDFINAVYANGYQEADKFILAQTPLPNTVEEFVSMLYQERCSCVVSLDEENMNDKTVAQYIPPANKVSKFGHFQVSTTKNDSKEDFIIRELKISRIGSPPAKDLIVRHYQYKGWKNSDNIPQTLPSFLNTIRDVDKARANSSLHSPILVHCL